jgi:hypothetical protein
MIFGGLAEEAKITDNKNKNLKVDLCKINSSGEIVQDWKSMVVEDLFDLQLAESEFGFRPINFTITDVVEFNFEKVNIDLINNKGLKL